MGRELDETAREALDAQLNAVIGTRNEDGSVNLAHTWFLFEDGRLYFETASSTRKARNVEARGDVSVLIGHPDIDVRAEGKGRLLRGDEAEDVNARIRAKYGTDDAQNTFFSSIDDCAVEITVDRWRTWGNAALRAGIQAVRESGQTGP
jgi:general stress protein 26